MNENDIKWNPGELYRIVGGKVYINVQISASQWLSDDIIEDYYKSQSPDERAKYECQKYMKQHPRKAASMTKDEYDKLHEKYLKKFEREEEKKTMKSNSRLNHFPRWKEG